MFCKKATARLTQESNQTGHDLHKQATECIWKQFVHQSVQLLGQKEAQCKIT